MCAVGAEEEAAPDLGEGGGGAAAQAGVDVLDQPGPGGGAVRLPELAAVRTVVGGEEESAGDGGEAGGKAGTRGGMPRVLARVDVPAQLRPGGGAVGLPELASVRVVDGGEEELPAGYGEIGGSSAADVDLLEQFGAGDGAIRLPELAAVRAVVGGEEEGAFEDEAPAGE